MLWLISNTRRNPLVTSLKSYSRTSVVRLRLRFTILPAGFLFSRLTGRGLR
jgi:hypothetical protein